MADETPKGFKAIFAAKMAALEQSKQEHAEARAAGVTPEQYADYQALKEMAKTGRYPESVAEAASALASAAGIARSRKLKPFILGGSKDLQWPPGEAFKTPLGYAPYLPRFKEVLAATFPQQQAAVPAAVAAAKPVNAPANKPPADPLAALRAMAQGADIKGESKPIKPSEVLATSAVPETDEPDE